jgi:xanthine dehydrogenase YagT iron-sulfur-binding subunit
MKDEVYVPITLEVNAAEHRLVTEPRRTLLETLRTQLNLTGAKNACDMGNCGACTVLVDDLPVYSCLTLAVDCDGQSITTIEGLNRSGSLDRVQSAFAQADAFQCGFCTPGQIMSVFALLKKRPNPSNEEIRVALSGNLCRCGAYRNIFDAARRAAEGGETAGE